MSGPASRARVHALRGRMDAIVIGAGTARHDDPLLTARPPGPRTPVRIVLGPSNCLPPESQLVRTAREAPVLLVTADPFDLERAGWLRQSGCEVLCLAAPEPAAQIALLLDELGRRRMTNIVVEGGASVLGSFHDAGAIDEVHVFIAPRLVGGVDAVSPFGGRSAETIAAALNLADWQIKMIDGDLLVHGRVP